MFVVSKNDNIVGFIAEESQKQFLVDQDPEIVFHEYDWTEDRAVYPSDFQIVDGVLSRVTTV